MNFSTLFFVVYREYSIDMYFLCYYRSVRRNLDM